jgi:hypothetical protein
MTVCEGDVLSPTERVTLRILEEIKLLAEQERALVAA